MRLSSKPFLIISLFIIISISLSIKGFSQPATQWQSFVGDSANQDVSAKGVVKVVDGYLIGCTADRKPDASGRILNKIQVYKLDFNGTEIWRKDISPSIKTYSIIFCIPDGNNGMYYATEVAQDEYRADLLVGRISGSGDSIWQQKIGGVNDDFIISIDTTSDGGLLVNATTTTSGDVNASWDIWLIKYTNTGTLSWNNKYGGSGYDAAIKLFQNSSGTYTIFASTTSTDGMVKNSYGNNNGDIWVVKTDSTGVILSQQILGGTDADGVNDVVATSDSGYAMLATTNSSDGDVENAKGNNDAWVVKFDKNLTVKWKKSVGGSQSDNGANIFETSEHELIFFGDTGSDDGDIINYHGSFDAWAVKLGADGELKWSRAYGSSGSEFNLPVASQSDNNNYCFVTPVNTMNGDLSFDTDSTVVKPGKGFQWMVKINTDGNILWQKNLPNYFLLNSLTNANDLGALTSGLGGAHDKKPNNDIVITKLCSGFPDVITITKDSLGFCSGDSVLLQAKPGFQKYLWSNGDTAQNIYIKEAGNYTVRVYDNNGCSANSYPAINVARNPNPTKTVSVNGSLSFCDGSSVKLTAEETNAQYVWNTGELTRFIFAKTSGDYYAVITNKYGCHLNSDTDKVTVYANPVQPVISYINDTLRVEFSEGLSYEWYLNDSLIPGQNKNYLIPIANGNYTSKVINKNGCDKVSKSFDLTTLAITTTSFNVLLNYPDVKLTWSFSQEAKTKFYKVQRSTNGLSFVDIGNVMSTAYTSNYAFIDSNIYLVGSKLYYRIVSVDFDGTYAYSKTETINCPAGYTLKLSPNPTKDVVYLTSNEDIHDAFVTVHDLNGKKLKTYKLDIFKNVPVKIDLRYFKTGMYLMTIQSIASENYKLFKIYKF